MPTEVEKAYAAGFFDGEGCISISKNGAVDIRITNTSKSVLEKLQGAFGGSITNRTQRINKAQYTYSFYGENAVAFVEEIKPYLVEKLPQAETILEYYQLRSEIQPVTIPGRKGRFANEDRTILVQVFRDVLTEQKLEEN